MQKSDIGLIGLAVMGETNSGAAMPRPTGNGPMALC